LGVRLSVGFGSADVRTLGAVDVVGLDVFAVCVRLAEPKVELDDISLDALKRLLAIGIGFVNPNLSWLVEVAAFVPNPLLGVEADVPNWENVPTPPLGVEEDVPNWEKPVALCEDSLSVDVAAVPKTEPVVVEDEGCTAAIEIPVAIVSGIWVFEGEGLVPKSPPVAEEDKDSAFPNE